MWLTWLRVLNVFLFLFWSASAQNIRSDTFVCPKENGFFAHDISCDKYWKCVEGVATLELCGNGLAFDDTDLKNQRENCDYIYNVECGDRLEVGESVPLLTWSIWIISRFNYWRLIWQRPQSAPGIARACTESSPMRPSATSSGAAGTARPAATSAPLAWLTAGKAACAPGPIRSPPADKRVYLN